MFNFGLILKVNLINLVVLIKLLFKKFYSSKVIKTNQRLRKTFRINMYSYIKCYNKNQS